MIPSFRLRVLRSLPLAAGLAACGAADAGEPATFRTRADGAVLVENDGTGAWTAETAWRAVEAVRIGRADGAGPDVLGGPVALETDDAGNLHILDAMAMEVRTFTPDGRHLRSFGRAGQGPGELRQPAGLVRGPEGTLWIYDPGNARFTVYDTSGTLRESRPRDLRGTFMPWPGRIDASGRLWDVDGAGATTYLAWREVGGARSGRGSLPEHRPEQFTAAAGGATYSAPVPFAPQLHWALDGEGRVWAGISDRYRLVHFVPGGDTLRVVELPHEAVAVAPAERSAAVEGLSWFTQQGGEVDAGRIPARKPAFTDVRVDDRGYLWVAPSLPADAASAAFDVFDPEGVYQGRLAIPVAPNALHAVAVRGERLYVVMLAEQGYPQVAVFRLEGRSGG